MSEFNSLIPKELPFEDFKYVSFDELDEAERQALSIKFAELMYLFKKWSAEYAEMYTLMSISHRYKAEDKST